MHGVVIREVEGRRGDLADWSRDHGGDFRPSIRNELARQNLFH